MRAPYPYTLLLKKCSWFVLLGVLCTCIGARSSCAAELRPAEQRGIVQVRECLDQERYAEAVTILEPLLRRKEHHHLLDFYRGLVARLQDEYREAVPWFERCVAADPGLQPAWINLAQCCFYLDDYSGAAQAFERSYVLSRETEPRWRYNAALAWFQGREMEAARKVVLDLLDKHGAEALLRWRELLVHIYIRQDTEESRRMAVPQVRILARQSEGERLRYWREYLVHLYLQLDMRAEALEYTAYLLDIDGLEVRWWRVMAYLHLEAGNYRAALVALQVAGFLAPGDAAEQRLRADLCMQLGIPAQAITYYGSLDPEADTQLILHLAQAYLQRHDPQQALEWLDKVEAAEETPEELRLRARILLVLERYGPAYAACVKLAGAESQPAAGAQAWMLAAHAALHQERWQAAREALRQAGHYQRYRAETERVLKQLEGR